MSEDLGPHDQSNSPTTSTATPSYDPTIKTESENGSQDNNNSIYQQYETNYVVMDHQEPTSMSAYLSSTFSLLESDPNNPCSFRNQEQKAVYYERNQTYYQQPVQVNGYPQYMMDHEPVHNDPHQDYNYEPAEKRQRFPSTARQCQQEYTDNFRRFINIPSTSTGPNSAPATNNSEDSGVQSPEGSDETDSEGSVSGGGTVMCPACKNVYNSPRSLTGHIGRTEKCREAIGRDYLEDIMKRGDSVCIPDAGAPGEGISPVCPHCNRFISHYKGNIRRHVNACRRASPRKESNASGGDPTTMTPFGYSGMGSAASSFDLASSTTTTTSNPSAMSLEEQCSSGASSSKGEVKLESMTRLEGMARSEGMTRSEGMVRLDGMTRLDSTRLESMTKLDGMKRDSGVGHDGVVYTESLLKLESQDANLHHDIHHESLMKLDGMSHDSIHHHMLTHEDMIKQEVMMLPHHYNHHMDNMNPIQPYQPLQHHMGYMHPDDPVVHQMQMSHRLPHGYVDYMPYDNMSMPMYQPVYNQLDVMPQPVPVQPDQPAPTKSRPPKHNGMVTPDDPYVCSWCTFTTVYKGNMKRHLISCHNCNDELLRKYNFELERLRKSAACRAGPDSLPFIEIRPAQPPGTRRPRNTNSAHKNMGRPKKDKDVKRELMDSPKVMLDNKAMLDQSRILDRNSMLDQNKLMIDQSKLMLDNKVMIDHQMPYVDANGIQYSVVPPPQTMDSYEMSMQFMNQPAQVLAAPNVNYGLIKDCGNDSGMGVQEEFGEVNQPLPGY
ncbi:unnamed protein product [Bursaphelenchus okinawaensis]|uniref:C2H2-type domain-containing protein n=1 Tax=Bursaphelenchus okinawaensis TaxID=465554 RepID=A0A811L584_9BILA|nr:unnamed protein product [Bursaphelenchus okinawaensis]CAG9117779.1 unnamed protein product [Bursaphelenchus okinawaensis]